MRLTNYHNNLIATAFMINLGINHHVKRFVFTSSMAVYGSQNPPFDEDLRPVPIDPYGVAKYACEMDIQIAQEQHGMEFCIIRPHNVYGRNQNIFDPYRNVLGRWMYQAKAGQAFTIYGDGLQTRAFSFIDDCLPCLWRAATSPKAKNQIINLGGVKETTLKDAADMLVHITGTSLTPVHLEARHEAKHAWSTYQKSVDLLDYKETFSLEEGLKSMWDSVKELPMKPLAFYDDYEVKEGIYSYWKR
jgi:UDP-glucose 4-epimerase